MPGATVMRPGSPGDVLHQHARRLIAAFRGPHRVKRLAVAARVSPATVEEWVYRDGRPGADAALELLQSDPAAWAAFLNDMNVLATARMAAARARGRVHAATSVGDDRVVGGVLAVAPGGAAGTPGRRADDARDRAAGAAVLAEVVTDGD